MKQLRKVNFSKSEVLEGFAKRVPNADKMLVDWNRDSLLVQFGGVHSKEYSIKGILDEFKSKAMSQGVEIVWNK